MSRRLERHKINATIDMTPLMDLTFMLLIIFVITVPSIYYKSDVKLTPPDSRTDEKMSVDEKSVYVELDAEGGIWIGQGQQRKSTRIVDSKELSSVLKEKYAAMPDMTVFLVGDKERQYKEVIDIANAVTDAGITQLSLVFNHEKGE